MNLPEKFIERTKALLGNDWELFREALDKDTPVSIRINPSKCESQPLNLEKVAWCHSGYYLAERPSFTFDPLFHAGCYYPQEASSMFVEQAIKQYVNEDVRVLDLCAAPGGKSTHLLSLLSKDSLLVSNEVIRPRANILAENIAKWGAGNALVTSNDPSELGRLESYFDVILVDAPCSGEGMFRKDEGAAGEWSEANVQLCKERQQRIVADIWPALKPDGLLIYSTCTYNTGEDEENVQWICDKLGAQPLSLDIPAGWSITGALQGDMPVYRFLPHKTKGEGFFLAVMRKTSEDAPSTNNQKHSNKKSKNNRTKPALLDETYRNYIKGKENYSFTDLNGKWTAIPLAFADDYNYLSSQLRIISAGVAIGEQKGKDFIPFQALALSQQFNKAAFPSIDIDWATAIAYLRKEALSLPPETERGYVLLTYRQIPLGFVKNIGNRANNLYPQEWRIRSGNLVESFGVL